MPITRFDGEHRFLSNFWPSPITYRGVEYPTVEHAYQAAKALTQEQREECARLPTPAAAKRWGRKITIRPDWEKVKLQIMEDLVCLKFQTRNLGTALIATGDQHLEEGNTWGDRIWGTVNGQGENHLGKILMKVRTELKTARKAAFINGD